MNTKITIVFPCYNQPELLTEALEQLSQSEIQTKKIIKDDCSSTSYLNIINDKRWDNLIYLKNQNNIGAIANMISCLFLDISEEYIMCHHEDDLLHKDFLQIAQKTLDNDPDLAFVASQFLSFTKIENIIPQEHSNIKTIKLNKGEMVRYFANDNNIAFGSVIYRKKYLSKKFIDLEKYSMLFDRPFLAELLNENLKGAIIKAPLYFYRHHSYPDNRWKGLNIKNIYQLYKYYKQEKGVKILSRYFFDFCGLENKSFYDVLYFIRSLPNLFTFCVPNKKSYKYFTAGLLILIIGKKYYSSLFNKIKKL
jgi:glycosyltransferase involved in cell wall biosynthesis